MVACRVSRAPCLLEAPQQVSNRGVEILADFEFSRHAASSWFSAFAVRDAGEPGGVGRGVARHLIGQQEYIVKALVKARSESHLPSQLV